MHPNPTYLPISPCSLSALATFPPKGNKQKKKINKNKSQWKLLCVMLCHIVKILLSKQLHLQMFAAMSHWTGLRPLASDTLSILDPHPESSRIACYCPMCEDAAAVVLQDWPLHVLQQFME